MALLDLRVEFLSGGPSSHAVYLLGSMEAPEDVSGWNRNTAAFDIMIGSGLSVVMPVGGESSFYSDWYQPAVGNGRTVTYKWETFIARELPAWLAANRGVNPTGNAVVGASMGGSAALTLAIYYPDDSNTPIAVGLPESVRRSVARDGQLVDELERWVGLRRHAGSARRPGMGTQRSHHQRRPARREQHPSLGVLRQRFAHRCRVRQPRSGHRKGFPEGFAIESNRTFRDRYIAAGGRNGVFNFPPNGTHNWGYWAQRLQEMRPDLQRSLGVSA